MRNKYTIMPEVLSVLITEALTATLDQKSLNDSNNEPGDDHHTKSQNWVKHFAIGLKSHYNQKNIDSFFNQRNTKDSQIKIKEFLFDITVAKTEENSPLPFISKPIWQIESEFAMRKKETIKDFQKLISGNAPYKMMVGPLNSKNNSSEYREITQAPATYISGDLFFLFIIHPENWKLGEMMVWKLYKWNGKDWGKVIKENKWKIENEVNTSL